MSTAIDDLPELVDDYLRVRRALGFKLDSAEYILNRFIAYLRDHDAQHVSIDHAVGFATAPPGASPRWQALRLSAVRCFARWAQCRDASIDIPPARILPARSTRLAPFIYTSQQLQALLTAASQLASPLRTATFTTLIALMASTGIRTGEALGLDTTSFDQDAGTLAVTGKYDNTRRLPLHPTSVVALSDYIDQRDRMLPAATCAALLVSTAGTRLRPSGVHGTFRALSRAAGIVDASSACRPRLHDLRHTFAVRTMLDAYNSGQDPATVLPILSDWLGHSEPRDTYWYLTGTADLFTAALQRLEPLTLTRDGDDDD